MDATDHTFLLRLLFVYAYYHKYVHLSSVNFIIFVHYKQSLTKATKCANNFCNFIGARAI